MEFLDEEWFDLFNLLRYFDVMENKVKIIIKNLILAMYELSEMGFYHCDMKPGNMMVNRKTFEIKLIDFEDFHSDNSLHPLFIGTYKGTMGYKSPESFTPHPIDLKQSLVFTIGCILYNCIEGVSAYHSTDQFLKSKPITMIKSSGYVASLIKQCTNMVPNKRITFKELLKHEWFIVESKPISNQTNFKCNNEFSQNFSISKRIISWNK